MTLKAPLRVGVVGCGWQGGELTKAVLRLESLRLAACADPDQAAANRVAALGINVTTHISCEALLVESEVDAVLIATPHHVLGPATLAVVQAGKHVMVEKPLALNEREAAQIERAVADAGVCYLAGYSMRFSMGQVVKDLLVAGAVGTVRAISASMGIGPLNEGWAAYPETGGGPLLYVGSHLIDMVLWFVEDEPIMVQASVEHRPDTGADQTAAFRVHFAKGAVAQCLTTQATAGFFYDFHIWGSDGDIALRGRNFLQYDIEVVSRVMNAYKDPAILRPMVWLDNAQKMLVPELEAFADAILNGSVPPVTIADGRRVLRMLDAVLLSSQHHQPIGLGFSSRELADLHQAAT
ncbi:MAG: Gfo/Idh/MocA family oxidoreductase [Chloroflexi bacterium]|nr:Gfo/Idh/MocA family oxidoreductase [Chloroflexota bacterium]